MEQVRGLTLLVTGGAAGLGYSIVEKFLENNAKLVLIADLDEKKGAETVEIMKTKFGDNKAVFYKCDVTKDLDEVFDDVIERYGYVDLLINNAGIFREKDFRKTIEVNTTAVIAWTMKFYHVMRRDRGGRGGTIINISSIYGYRISSYVPFYHASKFAIQGFTKSLGHNINFYRTGVRVVALCPGKTVNSMSDEDIKIRDDEFIKDFIEEVEALEGQSADNVGRGAVSIFQQAQSGEAWVVEGERPAEKVKV